MIRRRIAGVGVFALVALSLQILLGASAASCTSVAHSTGAEGAQTSDMAGMSMPGSDAGEHGHGDCTGDQAPVCMAGAACVIPAIPTVALLLSGMRPVGTLPAGAPSILRSALKAPDQPPPRA